jgi:Tfp pilus assembly PilM family ATPase/Tfp pilus assembly protein PilN
MIFRSGWAKTFFSSLFPADTRFAVELGSEWFKFAQSSRSFAGANNITLRSLRLPVLKDDWPQALGAIAQGAGSGRKAVTVCLPRHQVTLRILELPSVNPGEIANIVALHVGKQTPYAKDEIVYAHKCLRCTRPGYTRVLLAIAARGLLDDCFSLLRQAGVEPQRVILSSEALGRWFQKSPSVLHRGDQSSAVLLDIDSVSSDFIVLERSNVLFSRTILTGAKHLLERKDRCFENFLDELVRSLKVFHEEAADNLRIPVLYLSGAAQPIEGLAEFLQAGLGIPCRVLDPLCSALKAGDSSLREDRGELSFTPLLGALSVSGEPELDLMLPEAREIRDISVEPRQAALTAILLAGIIAVLFFCGVFYLRSRHEYLDRINRENVLLDSQSGQVNRMLSVITMLRERRDTRGDALQLLGEIHKTVPRSVYLTSLEIERKGLVTLNGRAAVMADVFAFAAALEKSPFLAGVRNTYSAARQENGAGYVDFGITAEYKPPQP